MKIVLSAGHDLKNSGAVWGGLKENEHNIAIRDKVFLKLKNIGADVIAVPDMLDLKGSIDFVNLYQDDKFALDIHLNASTDPLKRGCEIYALSSDEMTEKAKRFIEVFSKESGIPSRGLRNEVETAVGSLGWLRYVKGKPALIECLYLTNEADRSVLINEGGHEKIAQALFTAICDLAGIKLEPIKKLEEQVSLLTRLVSLLKKLLKIK